MSISYEGQRDTLSFHYLCARACLRERPVVWAIRYASRFRGLVCMISIDLRRAAWRCVVISLPCCIAPGCAGLRYMNCIVSLIYLVYFMEQAFSFRVFFEYKLPSGQAASQLHTFPSFGMVVVLMCERGEVMGRPARRNNYVCKVLRCD